MITRNEIIYSGLENIPKTPAILVANHESYLDSFVIYNKLERDSTFLAWSGFNGSLSRVI